MYAIGPAGGIARLASLTTQTGRVARVRLLDQTADMAFTQDASGLTVDLRTVSAGGLPVTLKITGLNVR